MNFNVPNQYQDKFIKMSVVGKLTCGCLDELTHFIKSGVSLLDIDYFVRTYANTHGLINAQVNYRGFPAACCTSVNHVICHGIPDDKILKDGDIVKVDCTFIKDGYYGDSCRTYSVGEISVKAHRLITTTYQAMWQGIIAARPGKKVRDIAHAIQKYVEDYGFSVVPDFCGHGIGTEFHCLPSIPHYVVDDCNIGLDYILKPGDTFTIEPMVNAGKPDYKVLNDGWAVVTRDREWSAQFEHTIGITNDSNVVFT